MRLPTVRPVRVLVVCTGNICRSPMGQMMLAAELSAAGVEAEVVSGATSDYEQGNPIDPRAAATLEDRGVEVLPHTSTPVTTEELAAADLVLAMTEDHARWLRRLAGRAGVDAGRVQLWRRLDQIPTGEEERARDDVTAADSLDVPDPWWGDESDFEATYEILLPGVRALGAALADRRSSLH